jgi:hypothetical protein
MTDQLLSEVAALVQQTFPNACLIVPPSEGDPQVTIYTGDTRTTIEAGEAISFTITKPKTDEPILSGDASSVSDVLSVVDSLVASGGSQTTIE